MDTWTKDKIPNLAGKNVVVTGGNSGLGFETVKALADNGAHVVLASRSIANGEAAREKIKATVPHADIEIMQIDLGDLRTVREFAAAYKKKYNQLDILVNNAGIMMPPQGKTTDGFELQLGINHFGHFALTGLLFDILRNTPHARIVNVSSVGHRLFGDMDVSDLQFEKGKYSPSRAYGRSKLANLMFTYELQRRLQNTKHTLIAVAAHPGGSNTNLGRYIQQRVIMKIMFAILTPLLFMLNQNAAHGALPQIRAAVDPGVKGGEYYGPHGLFEMKGRPVLVKSTEESHNKELAEKLWEISEQLTGVQFSF